MKRRLDQLNSDLTAKQSTLETLKNYLEQEHGYYFELDHYIDQCYSQQVSLYRKRVSCRSVNILIKFVLLRMLIKIQHIFYTLFWLFGGILDSRSCTSLGRTFNLIRYDHSKSKSSTSPSSKQQNPLLFNRMVFSKGDRCWNGPERSLTVYTLFSLLLMICRWISFVIMKFLCNQSLNRQLVCIRAFSILLQPVNPPYFFSISFIFCS